MTANSKEPKHSYFVKESDERAFVRSFSMHLQLVGKMTRDSMLSEKNVQRFRHGREWAHPGSPHITTGEMKVHSVYGETKFDDVVNHRLEILPIMLAKISNDFQAQFMKLLYETVNQSCEQSGNSVSAKTAGGLETALLQMMEKIEFSADANGKINFPQIHASPEMFSKFVDLEKNATPEFRLKMETLKQQKIREALSREEERKGRFLGYGLEQ